jgi:hypothetical protein
MDEAGVVSSFPMIRMVVGTIAVAVPVRIVWPAMLPSPKKSLERFY